MFFAWRCACMCRERGAWVSMVGAPRLPALPSLRPMAAPLLSSLCMHVRARAGAGPVGGGGAAAVHQGGAGACERPRVVYAALTPCVVVVSHTSIVVGQLWGSVPQSCPLLSRGAVQMCKVTFRGSVVAEPTRNLVGKRSANCLSLSSTVKWNSGWPLLSVYAVGRLVARIVAQHVLNERRSPIAIAGVLLLRGQHLDEAGGFVPKDALGCSSGGRSSPRARSSGQVLSRTACRTCVPPWRSSSKSYFSVNAAWSPTRLSCSGVGSLKNSACISSRLQAAGSQMTCHFLYVCNMMN